MSVREHGPVEQGLRHTLANLTLRFTTCQRARSSRTRIKTLVQVGFCLYIWKVREHGPVEQGLRLLKLEVCSHQVYVREHGPVEQGLRLFFVVEQTSKVNVREHGPVEQGLRQNIC